MVLTEDATPDTRELECNEIKTQVELATGRLGLRRAAREHSFPQMLYKVGLSTSHQPGSRHIKVARSSARPRDEGSKLSKEASIAGAGEFLAILHWSMVKLTICVVPISVARAVTSEEGAWCGWSGPVFLLAIFPNPFL